MAWVPVVHNVASFVLVRRGAELTQGEQLAVNTMQRNGPLWWDGLTPGNVVAYPCTHPLQSQQAQSGAGGCGRQDTRCRGRLIVTVTWRAHSCAFEWTRTTINASIGRWRKKESLKLMERMKENVIAWLASGWKCGLVRFVDVFGCLVSSAWSDLAAIGGS